MINFKVVSYFHRESSSPTQMEQEPLQDEMGSVIYSLGQQLWGTNNPIQTILEEETMRIGKNWILAT